MLHLPSSMTTAASQPWMPKEPRRIDWEAVLDADTLPQPGVDFNAFGPPNEKAMQMHEGGFTSEDIEMLELSEGDWASIGISVEGGLIQCHVCDKTLHGHQQLLDHVSTMVKPKKKKPYQQHFAYLKSTLRCWRLLQKDGWRLKRNTVSIFAKHFKCRACNMESVWWDCFNGGTKGRGHIWTRHHQTQLRKMSMVFLDRPPTEEEQQPWDALLQPFTMSVLDRVNDQLSLGIQQALPDTERSRHKGSTGNAKRSRNTRSRSSTATRNRNTRSRGSAKRSQHRSKTTSARRSQHARSRGREQKLRRKRGRNRRQREEKLSSSSSSGLRRRAAAATLCLVSISRRR